MTIEGIHRAMEDRRTHRGRPGTAIPARARSVLFWTTCAILPVALLVAVSTWGGVYPFGPESFLTEDLKYQYIDFFSWFRRVLTGDANIFYSFAQGMGSNTWGLYSYYLASPFNPVILLFDEAHLTLAVYVIVALKLACMNISMAWYVGRRFDLDRMWALTLALCYTWSTWTATNLRNPLWLDALILLPLMAWGCHLLIRKGKFLMLSLLVAADAITCWYMAYITLLFCCLFVLFELGVMGFEGGWPRPRWIAGRAVRFTGAIVLGMGLAAWTFVPTVMAMAGGGVSSEIPLQVTGKADVLKGFLPGSWSVDSTPQFYAGVIPLYLSLRFLCSKTISNRVRIMATAFAALIGASALFGPLTFVWCGLRMPNGFYCRFAFLMSFLEIWCSAYYLANRMAGREEAGQPSNQYRTENRSVRADSQWHTPTATRRLGLLAARLIPILTIAFAFVDLCWNSHLCWNQLYIGYPQESHESYLEEAKSQIEELRELDDDPFYRIEKTYNRAGAAFNEGMALEYEQLSTYSSANNPRAVAFLNAMGYSTEGEFSSVYAAPNLVMDSLLGVRYVSTDGVPAGCEQLDDLPASNEATLSKNTHALSLGYATASEVSNTALPDGENPFERQNALFSLITGIEDPLYFPLDSTSIDAQNGTRAYEVNVPEGSLGYVFVTHDDASTEHESVNLLIDGSVIQNEGSRFSNNVRALNRPGDESGKHVVRITPTDNQRGLSADVDCIFYALDLETFEEGIQRLSTRQFKPTVFEDGVVTGTYASNADSELLLSIPYDSGWSVSIDGKSTELSPAFGGGMSTLKLDAGIHSIEMTYRSPGLVPGCILSICSAAFICAHGLTRRSTENRKRRPQ